MCPDAPYFIILLCLMPDDFTRQEESTGAWVKQCICLVIRQVYSQLSSILHSGPGFGKMLLEVDDIYKYHH
jgi:hypothetical protein